MFRMFAGRGFFFAFSFVLVAMAAVTAATNTAQLLNNDDIEADCRHSITCDRHFRPVCASQGLTYVNLCQLNRKRCEHSNTATKNIVYKLHDGHCNFESCNKIECVARKQLQYPVCSSSGHTYPSGCALLRKICYDNINNAVHAAKSSLAHNSQNNTRLNRNHARIPGHHRVINKEYILYNGQCFIFYTHKIVFIVCSLAVAISFVSILIFFVFAYYRIKRKKRENEASEVKPSKLILRPKYEKMTNDYSNHPTII